MNKSRHPIKVEKTHFLFPWFEHLVLVRDLTIRQKPVID